MSPSPSVGDINMKIYHNVPKFSDRHVWANNVEERSGQDLYCLPFRVHLLAKILCSKTVLFQF